MCSIAAKIRIFSVVKERLKTGFFLLVTSILLLKYKLHTNGFEKPKLLISQPFFSVATAIEPMQWEVCGVCGVWGVCNVQQTTFEMMSAHWINVNPPASVRSHSESTITMEPGIESAQCTWSGAPSSELQTPRSEIPWDAHGQTNQNHVNGAQRNSVK